MTQLRNEGWIHHLARHAVACFLTRGFFYIIFYQQRKIWLNKLCFFLTGDLWINWEEGMKVFDELLLDADWSVNAGTWMWLSG